MKLTKRGETLLRRVVYVLVLLALSAVAAAVTASVFHLPFLGVWFVFVAVPFLMAEYEVTLRDW